MKRDDYIEFLQDSSLTYLQIAILLERRISTVVRTAYRLGLEDIRRQQKRHRFLQIEDIPLLDALRRQGKRGHEIAQTLGLSRSTLTKARKRFGLAPLPRTKAKL